MLDQKIGFIGSGQMARALARGLVDAKLTKPSKITIHDLSQSATAGFQAEIGGGEVAADNSSVIAAADVVILAVKPQFVEEVASGIGDSLANDVLLVSIAAGIHLETLQQLFGTERVIRVMPNTPCLVGKGASGYAAGSGASQADCELVGQLFSAVGIAFQLREPLLDAVTGLSGSGPAYIFTVIEALSDGGVKMGLPREIATQLAVQTVLGSAELVRSSNTHPAVLRERVASPAGTTIAGLQALEDRGVRAAMLAAVQAATERSVELGQST